MQCAAMGAFHPAPKPIQKTVTNIFKKEGKKNQFAYKDSYIL
jgi:hypothetical protein